MTSTGFGEIIQLAQLHQRQLIQNTSFLGYSWTLFLFWAYTETQMYSQMQHSKQIWIRMYINLILFCVKFNYTDLQMSQDIPQIQIKNCFLVLLIATFIGIFFFRQEYGKNFTQQTYSDFCVVLKPFKYIRTENIELEWNTNANNRSDSRVRSQASCPASDYSVSPDSFVMIDGTVGLEKKFTATSLSVEPDAKQNIQSSEHRHF